MLSSRYDIHYYFDDISKNTEVAKQHGIPGVYSSINAYRQPTGIDVADNPPLHGPYEITIVDPTTYAQEQAYFDGLNRFASSLIMPGIITGSESQHQILARDKMVPAHKVTISDMGYQILREKVCGKTNPSVLMNGKKSLGQGYRGIHDGRYTQEEIDRIRYEEKIERILVKEMVEGWEQEEEDEVMRKTPKWDKVQDKLLEERKHNPTSVTWDDNPPFDVGEFQEKVTKAKTQRRIRAEAELRSWAERNLDPSFKDKLRLGLSTPVVKIRQHSQAGKQLEQISQGYPFGTFIDVSELLSSKYPDADVDLSWDVRGSESNYRFELIPHKANPPNPKKVSKAKKKFKKFHGGKKPDNVSTQQIDVGDVWYCLGEAWQIGYMSPKETGSEGQKYIHTMNEESKDGDFPKLYATIPDNGEPLLIIKGGSLRIEERGDGIEWLVD
jgi:hypothetical protein